MQRISAFHPTRPCLLALPELPPLPPLAGLDAATLWAAATRADSDVRGTTTTTGVPIQSLLTLDVPESVPCSLPGEVGLGANTVDVRPDPRVAGPDKTIETTLFVPMPTTSFAGTIADLNAAPFAEPLPDRCIIGDGSCGRAFIGIDMRPGTPLERAVRLIEAELPRKADGSFDPEEVIRWVMTDTERFLHKTPGAATNAPGPELPWDRAIKVSPEVDEVWKSVANVPVGALPKPTGQSFPVVPLERYLELGYGYCIQKSLLAALLLSRCGIGCRVTTGAVDEGPGKSSGHTWIALADGRWLDPTWQKLEHPTEEGVKVPGYRRFAGSYRFVNQRFPFLVAPSLRDPAA